MVKMNERDVIAKDFFVYTFFLASLAPGDSGIPISLTIQNDSQFLWQKTSFYCSFPRGLSPFDSDQDAGRSIPTIAAQFVDTSSARLQFSRATNLSSIAGSGEFPFILPETKIFQPKSTITLELSNYDAERTYSNIYVNMIGTKVYLAGDQ